LTSKKYYNFVIFSVIFQEINNAKKDKSLIRVDNILENDTQVSHKTIVNPCYGDPALRSVIKGGFIGEKAFIQPDNFYFQDDGIGFQKSGPRLHIALDPKDVKVAIVTCGGLCPGLNVVIREIVMSLWFNYGVRTIYGIKSGYSGIYDEKC
jgi:hypothetical protein